MEYCGQGLLVCPLTCPQSWGGSGFVASFPTALPVSPWLSLLCYPFMMPLRCSPSEIFIPGASLSLLEPPRLPWSFAVLLNILWPSLAFPSCCWSSWFSGVAAFLPELLLLCWSCCFCTVVAASPSELPALKVLWRFFVGFLLSSESFLIIFYDISIAS